MISECTFEESVRLCIRVDGLFLFRYEKSNLIWNCIDTLTIRSDRRVTLIIEITLSNIETVSVLKFCLGI